MPNRNGASATESTHLKEELERLKSIPILENELMWICRVIDDLTKDENNVDANIKNDK
jgi:hypothetical protein